MARAVTRGVVVAVALLLAAQASAEWKGGWRSGATTDLSSLSGDLLPDGDNTRDVGSAAKSWNECWFDGTATLATVDINGGTLDGVGIGASVTGRGAFSGITFDGTTANDAALAANGINLGTSGILFEGSSGGADASETILSATNPTADRAINLPNLSGTLLVDTAENAGNAIILGTLDLGKDDDISTLTIHDAGTIVLYDDSDDTSVTIGPVGNGGTVLGVTGTINATALQESGVAVLNNDEMDASSELAAIMDDETGTAGALVFSIAPALTGLPTLGNGITSSGTLKFLEDSDNGSNGVTLAGPASTADVQVDLPALAGTVALLNAQNAETSVTSIDLPSDTTAEVLNLYNGQDPETGETDATASLSFSFDGDTNGATAGGVAKHEAARLEAFQVSDWFHDTDETDHDSGLRIYGTVSGVEGIVAELDFYGVNFFAPIVTSGAATVTNELLSMRNASDALWLYGGTSAGILFEGTTNDYQTVLGFADPSADVIVTVPALTGTVQVNGVTDLGADADDAYTALVGEAGVTFTNTSDSDALVITLPNDPVAGATYSAAVVIAQTIQILPGAGESLYSGTTACATSYIGTGIGSTTTVRAVTGGAGAIWMVMTGTAGWVCTP